MDRNITITIKNRQGSLLSDTVKAVSSLNDKGPFDILPEHENFISLIKQKIIVHKNDNKTEEFKIDNGVLRVYKNEVNIYIGI
jgi:F0F1-type ATP synthase epsilon subunit